MKFTTTPNFAERSHPDFALEHRDRHVEEAPVRGVREAIRRHCANCPPPRACQECVFSEYAFSHEEAT